MAKKKQKKDDKKVPFDHWYLMLHEADDDIERDETPLTLGEFLAKIRTHFE